ncbi:hypothetical protein ACLKA6_016648 [Drosophila palustris]
MQRIFYSKFRPILCDITKWGAIAPMLAETRSFQASPDLRQKGAVGPGKLTPKMAKLQQQFQADNDKPVFLKGGSMDSILYRLTLVLCVLGTLGDLWLFFGYIVA